MLGFGPLIGLPVSSWLLLAPPASSFWASLLAPLIGPPGSSCLRLTPGCPWVFLGPRGSPGSFWGLQGSSLGLLLGAPGSFWGLLGSPVCPRPPGAPGFPCDRHLRCRFAYFRIAIQCSSLFLVSCIKSDHVIDVRITLNGDVVFRTMNLYHFNFLIESNDKSTLTSVVSLQRTQRRKLSALAVAFTTSVGAAAP